MESPLHTPASLVTAGSAGAPEMKSGADVGPGSDIFQRLLKERIVFIGSAIDQNTANLVCSQLILLEAENQERDISVYINSPGGSVTDGLAIYDTMQYVRCDVRTICVGLAASMGQFLLCAGTPGKRFALPHSRILMHQPSGGHAGPGLRHRHPGRADHLHEADAGRADRLPHRPAGGADRGRLGPRPLVHRRGGPRVRVHRRGDPEGRHAGPDGRHGVRHLMSLGIDKPASAPTRSRSGRRSSGGAPASSRVRATTAITVVNGKVQLGQRLIDLWRNRDLLMLLTRTELKVKYKESVLGYAWSMLNPALVLAIYYMIFKVISRTQQPHFAIWLFCGLLVWNLFNNSAMGSTTVVVGKAGIIKKVAFPRELLAMSTVGRGRGALRHPGRWC